ncbi:MAG: DUF1553 domain-containing protein [Planctomycetota bacterium]|nr:MAG: DUF1553 domain-containing protein [Planctomycetota bacterium]REJ91552.1 MAG: DUF1553 domain-containing protein [Planctomycetota bacterium]REK28269.1 MAG: DUF1553 domain-containing protein [Planctomycetota bacterium]
MLKIPQILSIWDPRRREFAAAPRPHRFRRAWRQHAKMQSVRIGPIRGHPRSVRISRRATQSRIAACLLATLLAVGGLSIADDDVAEVDRPSAASTPDVSALLARRCLECHSGLDPKGGLDLTERRRAIEGGDSGAAIVPGQPDESLLWQYVRDGRMPPEKPLSEKERDRLQAWIAGGAEYLLDPIDPLRYTTESRAGIDWWSLQPIERPAPPMIENSEAAAWAHNEIDRFVAAKLEKNGLAPSGTAERRVLLRRASFGLIGLPPTPEQLDAYLADTSEDAYEASVDRLLASEHYGERWARHWLDVVRYGESQGFERDKLRPNAWPYRDWVIDAFNNDLPYDEFARMQIAGDVLAPGDADAIAATGFLVAGPYDEVGQNQQSAAMRAVVRQDELEDIAGTLGQTFLGLTVNCARCHDHKFDPVSQREYYQLTAALAGVRHGERKIMTPDMEREIGTLTEQVTHLRQKIEKLEQPVIQAVLAERNADPAAKTAPQPISRWTFDDDLKDDIGPLHGDAHGLARVENGFLLLDGKDSFVSTVPLEQPLTEKTLEAWVKLHNLDQRGGGVVSLQSTDGRVFDAIVYGEREPARWMAGSNGWVRSQEFGGPAETEAADRPVHVAIVYSPDGTITRYREGRPYAEPYDSGGPVTFEADASQFVFGLRHGTAAGGNRMLTAAIDQIQVYDRALSAEEIAISAQRPEVVSYETIWKRLPAEQRAAYDALHAEVDAARQRIARLKDTRVYAVTPREAEPTHILLRGNPASPADVAVPAGMSAVCGVDPDFGLAADAPEAERRVRLAEWITSPDNPLFARVIVNRIWHYHFGAGLVESPNDLGFNGGDPSHPELLDYLAADLIEGGYRLKRLHRMIVTSATYRQASLARPECLKIDAANRLLWRKSPMRLEAEALRDAVLSVAGQLNPQVGGPPYQDFTTFVFNSQFYEMIDPAGFEFNRRTIYRTWLRSGRNSLLDAFDCPDPSTTAPRRAVTTTPVQSLALLNNSFILRMSDAMAHRVVSDAGEDEAAQIDRIYRLAYGRSASDREIARLSPFVEQHGLPALCRVVLNSNEFLYVE